MLFISRCAFRLRLLITGVILVVTLPLYCLFTKNVVNFDTSGYSVVLVPTSLVI